MMNVIGGTTVGHPAASVTVTASVWLPSADTTVPLLNGCPSSVAAVVVALMSVMLMTGVTERPKMPGWSGVLPVALPSVMVTTGAVLSTTKRIVASGVVQPAR